MASAEEKKWRARLREDQLAAIGNVITSWAFLERTIHKAFVEFLGIKRELGAALAANLRQADRLLELIESFGTFPDEKERKIFRLIRKEIKKLSELRDLVAHTHWWSDDSESVLLATLETRKKAQESAEIEPDHLRKIAESIRKCNSVLSVLVMSARAHARPPRTSSESSSGDEES